MPKTIASIRKKHKQTAGKARGKGVLPAPVQAPTPAETDVSVKTSIILKESLHRAAKERAIQSGVSYNGLINLALYRYLHEDGRLPPEIQAIVTARPPRPPAQDRRRADGQTPFTRPRLSDEEPAVTVTFQQAKNVWDMQMKHPNEDYSQIAKRVGVTTEMVLAAEAAQDDAAYQRWLATFPNALTVTFKRKKKVRRG